MSYDTVKPPSNGWLGDAYAERKLKTACGEVSYGRAHLIREGGGTGFHPLDVALGLTRMAVPEPVSLCIHVTYAETQTDNLGVSLDAVS